jgi:hypothetical protein
MNSERHRVSLSLTAHEYEQLISISDYLGIKPTSAAHRALTQGLSIIFNEGQKLNSGLEFAKINDSRKIQRLKAAVKPSGLVKKKNRNKGDGDEVVTTSTPELEPASVELSLNPETENKPAEPAQAFFDKQALRDLERVPKDVQRKLRDEYGSLTKAVRAGVRADRHDGRWRAVQYG